MVSVSLTKPDKADSTTHLPWVVSGPAPSEGALRAGPDQDRTRLAARTLEATDQELHAPNAERHAEDDDDDGIELGNHGCGIGKDTAKSNSSGQHIACTPLHGSELHDNRVSG